MPAIEIDGLSHHYGDRRALDDLSLAIERREVFAILGPNGGGKTTLFRILSTLIPMQQGRVHILDRDIPEEVMEIRGRIGVVFQAASLDRKLTAAENLRHHAALYGLSKSQATQRARMLLDRLGLLDRQHDLVEELSGGLRRRVELAKGMMHQPELLLMDEPSTGLDPGARSDLWSYIRQLREELGVTVALTTHLLEEAERADRIAILHEGRLVALDAPDNLRAEVGGDTITVQTDDAEGLSRNIASRWELSPQVVEGRVRLELPDGQRWIAQLMDAFGDRIQAITLGKPTLEDVFIAKTGHRFWSDDGLDEVDES